MNSQEIKQQLEEHGYCVIPNVISKEKCDEYLQQFQKWHSGFEEEGDEICIRKSVIQTYKIGHFEPAWKARLHTKPVFEQIWGTEKLLTSVDGVALSDPPREGDFRVPDAFWLHLDQGVQRQGCHAYQGAVYLEETTEKDYCFRVLQNSHRFHDSFYKKFPKAADKTRNFDFFRLNRTQLKWYAEQRCPLVYVPVPKGGMVLWDSRTVHDTDPPHVEHKDLNRWRCVVFVSMTPAFWAGQADLDFKRVVYENMDLTSHWSSQRLNALDNCNSKITKIKRAEMERHTIKELPEVAKPLEVKLLMGVEQYDFNDGKPNGPEPPTWLES